MFLPIAVCGCRKAEPCSSQIAVCGGRQTEPGSRYLGQACLSSPWTVTGIPSTMYLLVAVHRYSTWYLQHMLVNTVLSLPIHYGSGYDVMTKMTVILSVMSGSWLTEETEWHHLTTVWVLWMFSLLWALDEPWAKMAVICKADSRMCLTCASY
jgi:hypothetical protein